MKERQKVLKTFALISQLGFSLLVPVLSCTFLGSWLEERYSVPVFIPLLIMGVLAGIRNSWILIKQVIYEPPKGEGDTK